MIAVVQHIYCVNDWYEIAEEQIQRLISSGLYDGADKLFATLNIKDGWGNFIDDENKVNKLFEKYPKFEISLETNHYEYAGVKKAWDLGQDENVKVLYFHAKGVSNKYRRHDKQDEVSDLKVKSIKSWREVLEYFLIDNWRDCIEKLNEYDNVGVTCDNGWFWGNFWWSQSKHLKTKSEPLCHVGRWYYEAWLNEGSQSKNYEYYKFTFNPYRCVVSKKFYDGTYSDLMDKLELVSAHYGSFDIQTDEGRIPNDEIIEIDVTDKISELYNLNKNLIGIPVNNEYFGEDPHWGVYKQLRIRFKVFGFDEVHEIVFDEYRGTYFTFL
jgi:hypothetical protein